MCEKQCYKCISRRTNAKEIRCSLGIENGMLEGKCGSYESGVAKDDFIFEYGDIEIDQLTEDWLSGEDT